MDLNSNFLCLSFESYNTVTRTLYARQKRSNGLQKRFGDIKRTPFWEVSNFIVAFQSKTEIVVVRNLNPYRLLFPSPIVRFVCRWLRHFEPEHAAQVKLGCVLDWMEFPDDLCHDSKLWMSKLSSELRLTVPRHMRSEIAVAPHGMYP